MAVCAARRSIEFNLDAEDLDRLVQVSDRPPDQPQRSFVNQAAVDAFWYLIERDRARLNKPRSRSSAMKAVIFTVLAMLLFGCGESGGGSASAPSTPVTPVAQSASLSFSATGSTARTIQTASARALASSAVVASASEAEADFEMGDLNKTSTFLFILQNTGNIPATQVQLASDNPNVVVVPSQIGILYPTSQGGVQPVIQVTVQHGTSANGVGSAPTLPGGRLMFNISATASSVSASASLGMTARVTDFTLATAFSPTSGGAGILCTPSNGSTGPYAVAGADHPVFNAWDINDPYFWGYENISMVAAERRIAGPLVITNTGNTPIVVQRMFSPPVGQSLVFQPDLVFGDVTLQFGECVAIQMDVRVYPMTQTTEARVGNSIFRIKSTSVTGPTTVKPDATGSCWGLVGQQILVVPIQGAAAPTSNG